MILKRYEHGGQTESPLKGESLMGVGKGILKRYEHGGQTESPEEHTPVDGKVLKDVDGRDYVMFVGAEGGEPFKVYSDDYGWNEAWGIKMVDGVEVIPKLIYPLSTNEKGEYILNAVEYDAKMTQDSEVGPQLPDPPSKFDEGGMVSSEEWPKLKELLAAWAKKRGERKDANREHRQEIRQLEKELVSSDEDLRDVGITPEPFEPRRRLIKGRDVLKGVGGAGALAALSALIAKLAKEGRWAWNPPDIKDPPVERPIRERDRQRRYEDGGSFNFEEPKSKRDIRQERRAIRKEERQDERDMIPARFRNRGQEGLDDYRAMIRRRGGRDFNILESLKSLFQQQRGSTQKEGETSGMKCSKHGCSAYK